MRATEMDKAAAKSFAAEEGYEAVADHGLSEHQAVTLYLAGILHERERCAKVAEKVINAAENEFARGWNSARGDIAARIRSGP